MNQGAIAVEAVYGGSAEIGGGSIFEPMVARGNGLDIMFVAASSRIRSNPPDNSGIVVRTNDSIKTAKDLVGKKISAGLINSVELRPHARMAAAQRRRSELGRSSSSCRFRRWPTRCSRTGSTRSGTSSRS